MPVERIAIWSSPTAGSSMVLRSYKPDCQPLSECLILDAQSNAALLSERLSAHPLPKIAGKLNTRAVDTMGLAVDQDLV